MSLLKTLPNISLKFFWLVFLWTTMLTAQQVANYSPQNQLDLNHATREQISRLPIPDAVAQRIYEHILYRGYFSSIYELNRIPGLTKDDFERIKPLIRIEPFPPLTTVQEKIERIYYLLDRWSSSEGVNDAFVDLWIEKALDPINVNKAGYDELVNLQNVSPVDAVSILKYREQVHWLRSARDLRRTPGLSNYAYRSVRYFLNYKEEGVAGWHGNFLVRMDNTPFMANVGDQTQEASLSAISSSLATGYNLLPNVYYKSRLSYGKNFKAGISYTRNINEPNHYYITDPVHIPEAKFYLDVENQHLFGVKLRRLILGNYSLAFGQGVVMENTDFFTPRKSGYGFRKRFRGISGDNSRTREFTLRGLAAQAEYKNLSAIGFISYDSRDAILNRKPSSPGEPLGFNQFIVLGQRFPYALDDSLRGPDSLKISWLNSVHELTYGGHAQYNFLPGTFVGVSFYESSYDRPLEPDPYEIVGQDANGNENWDRRRVTADDEIVQSYGGDISRGTNWLWKASKSFRRVYGFDFQTVYKNIVLQGEYGELDKGGSVFKLGDDPKALVLSAYLQYPTFNVLALYRNYDLGYDNPYQRSFSNSRRYKGTIYEDYYYLQSVLYGQLYQNNPQPQPEEGFFLSTYYQLNRKITTRVEYDNWMRKSDAAKQYRLVGTINYRPVFPVTIQLRQKWQAREEQNDLTSNLFYKNLEFRGRLRFRLSGYDRLDLMYAASKLVVHPRPRVFGDIVLDGEAITANYIHNFNRNLKLSGMLSYYKGFLWNFEDTQFVVMDSRRGAFRYWISLYTRLSHHLALRMKYTAEHHKPVSNIEFQPWQSILDANPDKRFSAEWLRDYSNLYFVELNYNF